MLFKINKAWIIFALVLGLSNLSKSQSIQLLVSDVKCSFRGLSVVNDSIIWVSGSNGTVGKSINGGANWEWLKVKGFENTQFRDIEAFSSAKAIIMGIDSPGVILKTQDGGLSWNIVLFDSNKGVFFDAMDFYDEKKGILVGDPIHQKFYLSRTNDGGETWQKIPEEQCPTADSGEACFASSGTNIKLLENGSYIFVSGGKTSHLFSLNKNILIPLVQGKESTGANSIAIKDSKKIMIVGGDFYKKEDNIGSIAISKNKGKSWKFPQKNISGYRSCIEYLGNKTWIACGLNGVDITNDDGNNFNLISKQSFHVCKKAKVGKTVFFAGNNVIGKLLIP